MNRVFSANRSAIIFFAFICACSPFFDDDGATAVATTMMAATAAAAVALCLCEKLFIYSFALLCVCVCIRAFRTHAQTDTIMKRTRTKYIYLCFNNHPANCHMYFTCIVYTSNDTLMEIYQSLRAFSIFHSPHHALLSHSLALSFALSFAIFSISGKY